MLRFHIKNLKKHWIFPLLAGCLVIFISLFFISLKAVNLMKEDKINESEKIIYTVRQSVDHYLFTFQSSSSELMLNIQNIALQSAESQDSFTEPAAYKYSELISNVKTANALIDDIFLYYPAQDYIVGAKGNYISKNYYLLSNSLSDIGYANWKSGILESENMEFFFYKDSKGKQDLYFRHQMPASKNSTPLSVLIIRVNSEEFTRMLSASLPHDGSTSISVFSADGDLYQSDNDDEKDMTSEIFESISDSNIKNGKMENKTYIGWKLPSEYSSFYYAVVSNKAALLAHLKPIQYLLVIGIVLFSVVGALISLILGAKQHRSTEQVINSLNDKVVWSLKENTLTDILNQRLTDIDTLKVVFQTGGIPLDFTNFCILLADVSFEKNKNRVKEWIYSAGKLLEQQMKSVDVIPALVGKNAIFLFNYESTECDPASMMLTLFPKVCNTPVNMRCSEIFLSVGQLVSMYEQTFLIFQNQLGILDSEISEEKEGNLIYDRWNKALAMREYKEAGALLQELFDTYVRHEPDPYVSMSRQYAIINSVIQCVKADDLRFHTHLLPAFLENLKNHSDTEHILSLISEMIQKLESLNKQYMLSQQDSLATKIKKIVEENYTQHYLGLAYIAEQVKVSTSYVSKVFKDEYGTGIVEYINYLRIKQAKKIMESEALTVKEIAEKVGFTSDIHFIRTFKKYENMTPGVYQRQSH